MDGPSSPPRDRCPADPHPAPNPNVVAGCSPPPYPWRPPRRGWWAGMVTLGGGSGWGVLLDDPQMPTSGTGLAQAVQRACPHPAAQGRDGTSRRGEHPTKPSRAAGSKRRLNTRNTLACNTRNHVDWGHQPHGIPTESPTRQGAQHVQPNTRTYCGYYRYFVTVDHLPG